MARRRTDRRRNNTTRRTNQMAREPARVSRTLTKPPRSRFSASLRGRRKVTPTFERFRVVERLERARNTRTQEHVPSKRVVRDKPLIKTERELKREVRRLDEKLERKTCKDRPNPHKGGGGGKPRNFVPWCDRKG